MKRFLRWSARVDSSADDGRRWLCRPVTWLIADQSNFRALRYSFRCCLKYSLRRCLYWLVVQLRRRRCCLFRSPFGIGERRILRNRLFCLCIRWSNSGVIHGQRIFFLLRKETIGATSSTAFKNLFFHSNHMLLIPEHVSSISRSAWLPFFHFLVVRIWDLFVWAVLMYKIVVTSPWSVTSRCVTWAVVFLSLGVVRKSILFLNPYSGRKGVGGSSQNPNFKNAIPKQRRLWPKGNSCEKSCERHLLGCDLSAV